MFWLSIIIGILLGLLLATSVRIVSQWERMLVLRWGKYVRTAEPGMRFTIPIAESALFVEMRTQTVDIRSQQTITKDNVPVLVNGVIFFRVSDAEAAALRVQYYRDAMIRLAQATLRDVVGRLSLDDLLTQQERLEAEVEQSVEKATKAWGLHTEGIRLEDLDLPEELKKMMSRQASSEREKRATIIKAEGDLLASEALSKAAATMTQSPGAMQLRVLQTIDGLGPSASNTVLLAVPLEIMEAVRSITKANGGVPSTAEPNISILPPAQK